MDLPAGELVQLDAANPGSGVQLNAPPVIFRCGGTDIRLDIEFIPEAKPFGYRVLVGMNHIEGFTILNSLRELFPDFRLCLTQDIFNDPLLRFRVIASGVAALPAPVRALADVTFSVGPFL